MATYFRLSLPSILAGLSAVFLIIILLPTVVFLFLSWKQLVDHKSLAEATGAYNHVINLIETEIEQNVDSATKSIIYFDLLNLRYGNGSHYEPVMMGIMARLLAVPMEETMFKTHANFLLPKDKSAVVGVIPTDSVQTNGIIKTVYEISGVTIFPMMQFNFTDSSVLFQPWSHLFLDTLRLVSPPPGALLETQLGITPFQGNSVVTVSLALNMYRGVFGNIGSEHTLTPTVLEGDFMLSNFQAMLNATGRPTPNTELYLVYEGVVVAALPTPSFDKPIWMTTIATIPLRTPSGYNCFVDISGVRFATCLILATTIPTLNEFLSQSPTTGSLDTQTVRTELLGEDYFVTTAEVESSGNIWQFNLTFYAVTPVDDFQGKYSKAITSLFIVASTLLVGIIFACYLLSMYLSATIRNFYENVCGTLTLDHLNPPPPQPLSILSEVHQAQVQTLRVVNRIVTLGKVLRWLREHNEEPVAAAVSEITETAAAELELVSDVASESTVNLQQQIGGVMMSVGKSANAFLLLHITRRTLDPLMETQSVLFHRAVSVFKEHNAIVEYVDSFNIMATFRSTQHALRSVECARVLTAILDTLIAARWPDDVSCFIICDAGMAIRYHFPDLVSKLPHGASPSVIRCNTPRSFLTSDNANTLQHLIELQRTTLRSRLVVTDRLLRSLPQRIASVMTPIDLVEIFDFGTGKTLRVQLFEDPLAERIVRTAFTNTRRLALTQAFFHLVNGDLREAFDELKDFSGDPNSVDICDWHAFRWRKFIMSHVEPNPLSMAFESSSKHMINPGDGHTTESESANNSNSDNIVLRNFKRVNYVRRFKISFQLASGNTTHPLAE